jgi:hypothetical protein
MSDIAFDDLNYDMVITGGSMVYTSDTSFNETMRQKIRAYLQMFLGEWFLDDTVNPKEGIPYFQSLFAQKIPTIETADTVFRTGLLAIDGVTSVLELTFNHDRPTRNLEVGFKVTITGDGFVEDIIPFDV